MTVDARVVSRARARVLLAICTLAAGIGLGLTAALPVALADPHPSMLVEAPGQSVGRLDSGRHVLRVERGSPGSDLPLEELRPVCTALRLGPGGSRTPVEVATGVTPGFAALRVDNAGEHQISCSGSADRTVISVVHDTEDPAIARNALLRAGLTTLLFTSLAVVLAARPLLVLRAARTYASET